MTESVEPVIGNYKILNYLSQGQQTQICEVLEVSSNDKYAMKLLLPDAFKDSGTKSSLRHEANICKSLDHPNIIKFHEAKFSSKHGYYVMEMFRAPNLKNLQTVDQLFVLQRFKRIAELTAVAVQHMHDKGWLHLDLKPHNILVSRGGDLRLIDFSLAARAGGGAFLSNFLGGKRKLIQGTRTYLAPEQIRRRATSTATDVYSLGIMLFELLTGKPPFHGLSPNDLLKKHVGTAPPPASESNPNVTPEMDRLLLRMLSKKPQDRPKNMAEFQAELRLVSPFKEPPTAKEDKPSMENLSTRRDSRSDALRSQLQKEEGESSKTAIPVVQPNKVVISTKPQPAPTPPAPNPVQTPAPTGKGPAPIPMPPGAPPMLPPLGKPPLGPAVKPPAMPAPQQPISPKQPVTPPPASPPRNAPIPAPPRAPVPPPSGMPPFPQGMPTLPPGMPLPKGLPPLPPGVPLPPGFPAPPGPRPPQKPKQ